MFIHLLQKVDYITYLSILDHLFDIPRDRKNTEYKKYLEMLLDYLHDYLLRIKPLFNVDEEMEQLTREFNQQWEAGTFPGWQVCTQRICYLIWSFVSVLISYKQFNEQKESGSALMNVGAHLDLSAFSSWQELASLGLDRLKSALLALGLKCGG